MSAKLGFDEWRTQLLLDATRCGKHREVGVLPDLVLRLFWDLDIAPKVAELARFGEEQAA